MAAGDSLVVLAYAALAANCIVLILGIFAAIFLLINVKKKGVKSLQRASNELPRSLEAISFSEMPIAVVAVIAEHLKIPLKDLSRIYKTESAQRKATVLKVFLKDPVTDDFIQNYPSKFVQHGYVGEALLAQPEDLLRQ